MRLNNKVVVVLALLAVALLTMAPTRREYDTGQWFADVPFEMHVVRAHLEGDPDRPIIVGIARLVPGDNPVFLNGQGLMQFRATVNRDGFSVSGRGRFYYVGDVSDGTDIVMDEGSGVARFSGTAAPPASGTSSGWVFDVTQTGSIFDVSDSNRVLRGWTFE